MTYTYHVDNVQLLDDGTDEPTGKGSVCGDMHEIRAKVIADTDDRAQDGDTRVRLMDVVDAANALAWVVDSDGVSWQGREWEPFVDPVDWDDAIERIANWVDERTDWDHERAERLPV